jgi:hypothetical protein
LVSDTEETRLLAGQRVTVVELSDGTVQARHGGKPLPLTRCQGRSEISQGAIVSNKLLAGALQFVKDKQAEKDLEQFSKLRTKRDRQLLEKRTPEENQSRFVEQRFVKFTCLTVCAGGGEGRGGTSEPRWQADHCGVCRGR